MTTEINTTKADLVFDYCAGSALIIPMSKLGELFIRDLNGQRYFGAAFCRRDYAEILAEDAAREGLVIADANDRRVL
jgi:hypothetical protein